MKQIAQGIYLPDNDTFFVPRDNYEIGDYKLVVDKFQSPEKRRVAIDVGAHIGFWSRRLVHDFETVYSFEPVPDHYECLVANTESADNCHTFNVGCADTPGVLYFEQHIENSGMSKVSSTPTNLSCPVVKLDTQLANVENIDLIKIDTEGYEINVLQGAENLITKFNPSIFCEIWNHERRSSPVFGYLESLGYTMVQQYQENYLFQVR